MSSGVKRSRSSSPVQHEPQFQYGIRRQRSTHSNMDTSNVLDSKYLSSINHIGGDDLLYLTSGLSTGSLMSRTNCQIDLQQQQIQHPEHVSRLDTQGKCVQALTNVMILLTSQLRVKNTNEISQQCISTMILERDITQPAVIQAHTEGLDACPLLQLYIYALHSCIPYMKFLPSCMSFLMQVCTGEIMLVPATSLPVAQKWSSHLQTCLCFCPLQNVYSANVCTQCEKRVVYAQVGKNGSNIMFEKSKIPHTNIHSLRIFSLYVQYQAVHTLSKTQGRILSQWQCANNTHTSMLVTTLQRQNIVLLSLKEPADINTDYRVFIGITISQVLALFQHILFSNSVPLKSVTSMIQDTPQQQYSFLGGGCLGLHSQQCTLFEDAIVEIKQTTPSPGQYRDLAIRNASSTMEVQHQRILQHIHAIVTLLWIFLRHCIIQLPTILRVKEEMPASYTWAIHQLQDITASLLYCTESCPAGVISMHASNIHSVVYIPLLGQTDSQIHFVEQHQAESSTQSTLYIILRQSMSCLQYDSMYSMQRYTPLISPETSLDDPIHADETHFDQLIAEAGYLVGQNPHHAKRTDIKDSHRVIVSNSIDLYYITTLNGQLSLYSFIYSIISRYCDFDISTPFLRDYPLIHTSTTCVVQKRQIVCEASLLLGIYLSKNPTCLYSFPPSFTSLVPLTEILHAYYSILIAMQKLEQHQHTHRTIFVRQIYQLLEQYHSKHTDLHAYISYTEQVFLAFAQHSNK